MRSSWGRHIVYSLFGESHGPGIGMTMHHLPAGFQPEIHKIRQALDRRRPGSGVHATPRQETDVYQILSGIQDGILTGAPLTVFFPNTDTRSGDYRNLKVTPRPSHSDYAATMKYKGFHDHRGGGHFSGRLTAPVVFAGALVAQLLEKKGTFIGCRISQMGPVTDSPDVLNASQIASVSKGDLKHMSIPMLSETALSSAVELLGDLREKGDSCGGRVEVCVTGVPAGWGEPFFDSLESTLAHLLFSVPGIKAVEFGAGRSLSEMRGSEANDAWEIEDGAVTSRTNNSGGINGGISNGMPICFSASFRPTPSIAIPQNSIDLVQNANSILEITGRHDPCIVPRACAVVEAVTAMGLMEALLDQQIQNQEAWGK